MVAPAPADTVMTVFASVDKYHCPARLQAEARIACVVKTRHITAANRTMPRETIVKLGGQAVESLALSCHEGWAQEEGECATREANQHTLDYR